jgi:hypothetical protein
MGFKGGRKMKSSVGNKKVLLVSTILLVMLVSAFSFWQFQNAGAASVKPSKDYVSIQASLSPASDSTNSNAVVKADVKETSAGHYEIAYPGSGSKIEVGDVSKSNMFKPDLTVSTWDNEAGFQLVASGFRQEESHFLTSMNDGKISASNNGWIFEYKPTELKEGFNDQGGLDILITAKEKPSSSSIDFTFESDTVTPYFQPPLTAEYKDGWSDEYQTEITVTETQVVNARDGAVLKERPDYVVNSIAFYADAKADGVTTSTGKEYKTGKVGHLYRMKAVDAKGNSAWFDWAISSSQIKLVDSTGFLQTASYPVVIQPLGDTFGYTTVGASWNAGLNRMFMEKAAPASNGTLTSIKVYITQTWSGNPVKCALYNHSTSALVATTEEKTSSASTGWLTFNVNGTPSVSAGTNYWVLFWGSGSAWVRFAYDSGGAPYGSAAWRDQTYGSYPDPLGTLNLQSSHDSFYATYTPSGGGISISNTPSSYNFGTVDTNATISTGLNYFTVTNNSGSAVNITIGGTDVTGGTTWTLSDTGTPGTSTYGLKAGLNGGSYNIVVRRSASYNTLKASLGSSASQGWGLQFLAPTNYTDSVQKTGTVTLTASSP